MRFSLLKSGFLSVLLSLGWGCSSVPVLHPWEKARKAPGSEVKRIRALGRIFTCQAWGARAKEAVESCLLEVKRVHGIAEEQLSTSEVARLNATGHLGWFRLSSDLKKMLEVARAMGVRSGGAFDVTFAPIASEMERYGDQAGLYGENREFMAKIGTAVKDQVGMRHLLFDEKGQAVKFSRLGVRVVLKGLARGYAVEQAAQKMESLAPEGWIVEGGGVMSIAGRGFGESSRFCVEDPDHLGACLFRVQPNPGVYRLALAHASSYDRPGKIYHPKTGERVAHYMSATLVGESPPWLQAASTTVSILDEMAAPSFLEQETQPLIRGVYFADKERESMRGKFTPFAQLVPLIK